MGIYTKFLSPDKLFMAVSDREHVIVNDINNSTKKEKEDVNTVLYTTNGNVYNNIPKCQCGQLKSEMNIGRICTNCHTPVKKTVEEFLEPYVFIRRPKHVSKLMNVKAWMMLRQHFEKLKGKFDLIRYLTDTYYEPEQSSADVKSILAKLEKAELNVRSYNHFIENFDTYMDFLFDLPEYKVNKNDEPHALKTLLLKEKNAIFADHIPILNKTLLVVEETNAGFYIDNQITKMVDAVRLMIGIDNPDTLDLKPLTQQSRTSRCLTLLSDFYMDTYKEVFNQKSGLLRRHVFGTRADYSFRTVVSSITEPHNYDEIHIPWSVACNVLKLHITNKLLKMGWVPNQIQHFLDKYSTEWHPLLRQIFDELIAEAKEVNGKGIPCLSNRNPSLLRGSIMRCYICKIKDDVDDLTTSISALTTPNQNADFDGDKALTGKYWTLVG